MLKGSCLCGKVRYQYDGDIEEIAMCHCSQCRKAQGSAFATNTSVETSKLHFTGTEYIKEFQSNALKVRAFCINCGSPLYSAREDIPDKRRLRLGTVETPFECKKQNHIFVDSKAPWFEITDSFHQFK